MKQTAFLLVFLCAAQAQMSIPSLSNSTFKGQSDARGNQWGELTINLRTPVPAALLGAPFSGKEERRSEQLLPDGARITQPNAPPVIVARDAQGRTRVERPIGSTLALPGRPALTPLIMIEINDPVAGYLYVVDSARRLAYRVKYTPVEPRTVKPTPTPTLSVPARDAKSPKMTVEPIGAKLIQGVQAEGRRTTMIYPSGAMGNGRPMTEVQESWIVPSLQITVLSTSKSPTANITGEITSLSTVNPPPDLFLPPSGYEVRDQPVSFTVQFGNRPGANATAGTQR